MFRMKGFTRHLIFYRPIKNGVEIIRVIHGAREAFQFLDARCDRVVENVLNRIRG